MTDLTFTIGMPVRVIGHSDICHVISGWRFAHGQPYRGGMYSIEWPDGIQTRHAESELEVITERPLQAR